MKINILGKVKTWIIENLRISPGEEGIMWIFLMEKRIESKELNVLYKGIK